MPYLLPFDNVLNSWFSLVPTYGWEPVPPAEGAPTTNDSESTCAAAPDGDSSGEAAALPSMQWVFKGLELVVQPVWNQYENPHFELIRQGEEREDEERSIARRAAAAGQPVPDEAIGDAPPAADIPPSED